MYHCDNCYKEIDSYDYYKNNGLCDYCYYGINENNEINANAVYKDLTCENKRNDKLGIDIIYLSDGSIIIDKDAYYKIKLIVKRKRACLARWINCRGKW